MARQIWHISLKSGLAVGLIFKYNKSIRKNEARESLSVTIQGLVETAFVTVA